MLEEPNTTRPGIRYELAATSETPVEVAQGVFGIRLALGAESRSVLGLVVRQGLLLAVLGASLLLRGIVVGRGPWGNMFEFSGLLALLLVVGYLALVDASQSEQAIRLPDSLHLLTVVATGANGYENGKDYALVITTGTVGGVSVVGEVVAEFSIGGGAGLIGGNARTREIYSIIEKIAPTATTVVIDGETGKSFAPRDIAGLANAVRAVLDHPAAARRQADQQRWGARRRGLVAAAGHQRPGLHPARVA